MWYSRKNERKMTEAIKLSSRQRYHQAHRDEDEYMEKQRTQRMASYYKNQEREKAAALARYYKRKELAEMILSGRLAESIDLVGSSRPPVPTAGLGQGQQ